MEQLKMEEHLGRYPPTSPHALLTAMGSPVASELLLPNRTNVGIETVVLALRLERLIDQGDFSEVEFGNTDGDRLMEPLGGATDNALRELIDTWGNPLCYIHHDDYERRADDPVVYVDAEGNRVLVSPRREDKTGKFFRRHSFQLFSFGPDGKPGTDDDMHFGE